MASTATTCSSISCGSTAGALPTRLSPPALLQIRPHELIEVAVQHALRVGDLHLGAMIVDHGVRLKRVRADLAAPLDRVFLAAERRELRSTFFALALR